MLEVIRDEGLAGKRRARVARICWTGCARCATRCWPRCGRTGCSLGPSSCWTTAAPATEFVADVVKRMVARGFLMNRIGRARNTLKIRPPMPFSVENADLLMDALDAALPETPVPA